MPSFSNFLYILSGDKDKLNFPYCSASQQNHGVARDEMSRTRKKKHKSPGVNLVNETTSHVKSKLKKPVLATKMGVVFSKMGVVFWSIVFLGLTLWAGLHNCEAVVIEIGLNCVCTANLALWSRSRSL